MLRAKWLSVRSVKSASFRKARTFQSLQ